MRFYFDYAATTPVDPRVKTAMEPYFSEKFGNPSSLHFFGQEAVGVVDEAREKITHAVGADFREIVFTGSATEANNLALRGVVRAYNQLQLNYAQRITAKPSYNSTKKLSSNSPSGRNSIVINRPRLIVSAVEHESILETARDLESDGVEVVYLPVDRSGVVDLKALKNSLNERTILVSVMYANNEVGTIQPISEIAEIIGDFRKQRANNKEQIISYLPFASHLPLFHTDAVQALQFLDCDVNHLGVDLMTLSAHKIYGPKGIGALYVRQQIAKRIAQSAEKKERFAISALRLTPIITGGGQEFGLRSGTESVPAIAGFGKAVELISNSRELANKKIAELRDYFWQELKKIYPRAQINGPQSEKSEFHPDDPKRIKKYSGDSGVFADSDCLPNILNIYFPDYKADYLLTKFDLAGIAVSSGSACSSRASEPSYVIKAMGYSEERAGKSLRFSFGRPTARGEIDKALKIIKKILEQ